MNSTIPSSLLALAVFASLGLPTEARAETRACTPITSLPANLGVAGVYCLTGDLATSVTSGNAITISNSNIILDCNGYKVGGLAAGPASQARGIATVGDIRGVLVRNCSVRGFRTGIQLAGVAVRAEDNRLDRNLSEGIRVESASFTVARNRVFDTGNGGDAAGIVLVGSGLAIDNSVTGVDGAANGGSGNVTGMAMGGAGPLVLERNRIRGVATTLASATALDITGAPLVSLRDNSLLGSTSSDTGVSCDGATAIVHSGNLIASFSVAHSGCGPDLP